MTKMAAMPIYGKSLKHSSPIPLGRFLENLVWSILGFIIIMPWDDLGLFYGFYGFFYIKCIIIQPLRNSRDQGHLKTLAKGH